MDFDTVPSLHFIPLSRDLVSSCIDWLSQRIILAILTSLKNKSIFTCMSMSTSALLPNTENPSSYSKRNPPFITRKDRMQAYVIYRQERGSESA